MSALHITGFEILEKIGEGGMASVWKARQLSLDRIVAVKVLTFGAGRDVSEVERFLAEARSAAKLKHPGIVQVYDVSAEENLYYIVMEYVAAYTVGDWVRRKGVLPESEALVVVDCIADALGYAWSKEKIIHCDIKPDNVIVDSDGTVKVADLGLARSLKAMKSGTEAEEEVMGTPAYISPEQAQGMPDLDCRADIYSLGAMLYHLVTGKMLFAGNSDEAVMELQVNGQAEDPMAVNPKVSGPVCCLIERMLAKDRDLRPGDWDQVRADIAKAKKGRMPYGAALPKGASTVTRSKLWVGHEAAVTPPPATAPRRSMLVPVGAAAAILAAVIASVIFLRSSHPPPVVAPPVAPGPGPGVRPGPAAGPDAATLRAKEMYEFAKKWSTENPGQYAEAISRFQKVVEQTSGSKYSLMAEDDIKALAQERDGAVAKVMAPLNERASELARLQKYDEAVAVYEGYTGPMAPESKGRRAAEVKALRLRQAQAEEEKRSAEARAREQLEKTLGRVVETLLKDGLSPAHDLLAAAVMDKELAPFQSDLSDVSGVLSAAIGIDTKILDSFQEQKGKEISVQFGTGKKTFVVKEVRDGKVMGFQRSVVGGTVITGDLTFGLDALAPEERLKRMGNDSQPEVALVKGLMAWNSKNYLYARQYFGSTHPKLASRLISKIAEVDQKKSEEEAQKALGNLLRALGVFVGPYDRDTWTTAISSRKCSPETVAKAGDLVMKYKALYGATSFAEEARPVLEALAALKSEVKPAVGPGPQPGQEPAALPPLPRELAAIKDDFEAVHTLFLRKNRQLKPHAVIPQRNGEGKICGLQVDGGGVEDLLPLAAFSGFTSLCFRFYPSSTDPDEKGSLRDLAPLKYLRLETLIIRGHRVSDLGPLRSIPTLRSLDVSNTGVRDIYALKGLDLVSLNVSGTKVLDFNPIVGAQLKHLDASGSQVKNIAFVKQMFLDSLDIGNTKVYDFSPLTDLRLKSLKMSGTQVKTLDVLKRMALETLDISNTSVSDLTPVAGQKISRLDVSGSLVKDFSVLAEWPLTYANLARSKILDLQCLKGKDLTWLDISGTSVSDLSPLKDMENLGYLNISQTRVRGLSALKGIPVQSLVADISSMDEVSWLVENVPGLLRINGIRMEGEWRQLMRERLNTDRRPPSRHRPR